jgi:HEPN domain-containing protein
MRPDPELVAETKSWLQKAQEDLAVAQHGLSAETPFLAAALFHAQQAAEKAFKGFLT